MLAPKTWLSVKLNASLLIFRAWSASSIRVTEAPEVRWERDSQTYLAECGCGWRYFASTLGHAQLQASEHARDEHHV